MITLSHCIEPPFCLVHGSLAPCLLCLEPEVAGMVNPDNCFDYRSVIFTTPSLDQN